ncbi:protein of unknown function [Catalinimonas alkaloidigena]|uniref:YfiR family protein n=1 Tax=Catalinimonas alkaloidigena TaxID=1075417 RepID=A0A1G9DH55_9BACT|nr:YfiR family protein [Catalinimonas alkaloidigena]SDK63196.1 protein of unknown function [Catalinimonas alkaloidigena]
MFRSKKLLLSLVLMLGGGLGKAGLLRAQASEDKVKAVFIYSFVKYVEWNHPGSIITIGVYGNDDVLSILQNDLPGKKLQGKSIEARRIQSASEAQECQVVYLPKTNSAHLSEVVAATRRKESLVVTEEDLAAQGAGISFVKHDSKLGFVINKKVLELNQLKVVPTLYNVGKVL